MVTLADPLGQVFDSATAEVLAEVLDLHTVEDLLRHYPHRYASQGRDLAEKEPPEGEHVTIIGRVTKADTVRMKSRRGSMLKVVLSTDVQPVDVTFFNAQKVGHVIKPGVRAMFSGTVKYFRGKWSLTHPSYLVLPEPGAGSEDKFLEAGRLRGAGDLAGIARAAHRAGADVDLSVFDRPLIPIYPATRAVESWTIMGCVGAVLDRLDEIDDPLPDDFRAERGSVGLGEALRKIHLPSSREDVAEAEERLRFDEALALQLVLARRRRDNDARVAPVCAPRTGGIAEAFDARLPFDLTDGQLEVAGEISGDLSVAHPMSRLLQGEVGSGKTIVALRAMLQVVDAGHQCALLAPTEVLATQHARSLRAMLGDLATAGELGADENATRLTLLTGSMSVPAKRAAMLEIVSGEAGIVIGTHALIQDNVEFFDLGMVVVDEQHRFGVEQRDRLRSRARPGVSPHLLVMTATPIPRTIAMTVLGDLDVSTLRQLPRGRSPIKSSVVPASQKPGWVARAWERIREEVADGRQAYVVCSRIGDGEKGDGDDAAPGAGTEQTPEQNTVSAVDLHEQLRTELLPDLRVGLLHGRLPADEKDAVMGEFTAGDIDVLVCTTVVEVGVDVPNATVMVIVDADRFGVSQLHQLRGRVGRGAHQGLCILVTQMNPGSPAYTRLSNVASTNDGFELAQLDLATRREGDILGAAQSGTSTTLRLLSLLAHEDVIAAAAEYADRVVSADPNLSAHPGLAGMVSAALDTDRIEYLEKT
ncbi:ATP-dependent DNA helicase RecG [Rhodococcus triatomae]|uniref:ATP-dependent DNA helicase RecG n=1 Tax=Rhodococcus triatomae TaxID=300028 RepID=A0A1G8ENJ5_9NOCA|nr:ATP-dependent DNA helicase RecG [Rhodococcus triatomae]QNG19249.1 ATP-dependent DNA helicase RecG [Rhodococcus triatomae]QNG24838.1 ATP-dependent DNA helicase RecG [Rhodococcus triatomae]SDH71466.1 ATP-dependent DNA helicase RecG [Rhodococcus triatomae]